MRPLQVQGGITMKLGGIAPAAAVSVQGSNVSAGFGAEASSGAGVGVFATPAVVLSVSGSRSGPPLVQTVPQLWKQELLQGSVDLLA